MTRRAALTAIAVAASVTALAGFRAQAPEMAATAVIVDRAGRYVDTYIDAFSAVVSEEHQVQRLIRPDGRVKKIRDLKSDFLLVKTGGTWPQAFRDRLREGDAAARTLSRAYRVKAIGADRPIPAAFSAETVN